MGRISTIADRMDLHRVVPVMIKWRGASDCRRNVMPNSKDKTIVVPGRKSLAAIALLLAAGAAGVYACPDASAEAACAGWCANQHCQTYYYACVDGYPHCGCDDCFI